MIGYDKVVGCWVIGRVVVGGWSVLFIVLWGIIGLLYVVVFIV